MQGPVDGKAQEEEIEEARAAAASVEEEVSVSVLDPSMSQVEAGRI